MPSYKRNFPKNSKTLVVLLSLCIIGEHTFSKALSDLRASINLMPLSVAKKLNLGDHSYISFTQNGDKPMAFPKGIIEEVLVKVDKFIFLVDFVVLDI